MVTFLFSICPSTARPALYFLSPCCLYVRFAAFLLLFVDQCVNGGDSIGVTTASWGNSGAGCVTSEEAPFSLMWPAR